MFINSSKTLLAAGRSSSMFRSASVSEVFHSGQSRCTSDIVLGIVPQVQKVLPSLLVPSQMEVVLLREQCHSAIIDVVSSPAVAARHCSSVPGRLTTHLASPKESCTWSLASRQCSYGHSTRAI
ncbi:hypothetical protein BaRGS_00016777 [Batillaria attramentaria]|uniref:Uncharacterized protein n=1 Tax=Batillaria attramentaria TaxID=370345 RepID=A0ABD0KY31_9CAEN